MRVGRLNAIEKEILQATVQDMEGFAEALLFSGLPKAFLADLISPIQTWAGIINELTLSGTNDGSKR
jgi:hypothetical protein